MVSDLDRKAPMSAPRTTRTGLVFAALALWACGDPVRMTAPEAVTASSEEALSVTTWPKSVIAEFETDLEVSIAGRDPLASVEWRFADGTLVRGTKIRHRFAEEGVTSVLVRATMGTGRVVQRQVPLRVSPGIAALGTVLSGIVPGGLHTCAIDAAATLRCWGYNGNGTVGDGTLQHRYSPTLVTSGLSFTQVATGVGHSCALTDVGAAYCWGKNESGQLGDGTLVDRRTPTAVLGGLTFESIDVGYNHSCGITRAGVAHCWGGNRRGQLGNGTRTASAQPVLVLGGLAFSVIRSGYTHSCGLQQVTGFAYCWGSNSVGQIGDGLGGLTDSAYVAVPTAVAGGKVYAQIDIGASHTCALLDDANAPNKTWCWGWNGSGQLGANALELCRGTIPCATSPVKQPSSVKLVAITAGSRHSCGLTSDGSAHCWGSNSNGELGDGTTTDRGSPVAVPNLQFKSIRAGRAFTCGVLLDNTARCWGYNYFGMLGVGDTNNRLVPTTVPGLTF